MVVMPLRCLSIKYFDSVVSTIAFFRFVATSPKPLRFQIAPYVDLCRRLTGSVQGRFADRSIAKGYRRGLISATAGTCGSAAQWRAGSQNPAAAPSSESADPTLMAAAKPELKASGESTDPLPENTATNAAMPNMPPRKRPMLKTPEALPISAAATELRIAFWLPMFPRKGIQWDIGSLRVREREVESSNIGIKAGHKRESPSHPQARAFPTWTYLGQPHAQATSQAIHFACIA